MKQLCGEVLWNVALLLGAFYLGLTFGEEESEPITVNDYQEISLVKIGEIVGDQLKFSISGPARVIFSEDEFVENDGEYALPLGQFPTDYDKLYKDFNYLGNAKTGKYYPTGSYPARGTEVQHRRFFLTKAEAAAAGFVATKLVK